MYTQTLRVRRKSAHNPIVNNTDAISFQDVERIGGVSKVDRGNRLSVNNRDGKTGRVLSDEEYRAEQNKEKEYLKRWKSGISQGRFLLNCFWLGLMP